MKEPEKLVIGVTETARMRRSRQRITKAASALCYILTGLVAAWAISLATQGEGLACVILAVFAGLLIWYAQDEKKTAPDATNIESGATSREG